MKIALGSDHAGNALKEVLRGHLAGTTVEVADMGTDSAGSVDYPDFAEEVAVAVRDGRVNRGVLVCATGIGMGMTANKVRGIRAAAP